MDTRREFIKKAAILSGGTGLFGKLPESIQRAMSIDPQPGTTYLDAEHVVLLMQENRSFDHCFGALQGVRGFNDPRAITLPDKNRVWLQTNAAGETYSPFRLDIRDTKATWMHSLPHSWSNQTDARNNGKFDKWLDAKKSDYKEYEDIPMTMGYYTREDVPFYYALADAFTICDQHFCSSLTGTTPNRLYFWTGTIREQQHENSYANVYNENVDYGVEVSWPTFPERLEENGISWKIYQNEISMPMGFTEEEDAWLANFGDSPLQWFKQYNVKFTPNYISFISKQIDLLPKQISDMEEQVRKLPPKSKEAIDLVRKLKETSEFLNIIREEKKNYTPENFEKLSQREKNLHEKAFSTNKNDPNYHQLDTLRYTDGGAEREVLMPKGDIFHQFREDVKNGELPAVSWLVAPEHFSDHPSSAWYGAWYISEALDILTQNPELWKKTIFILTYDENDGYFDHVPPFVAPDPRRPATGATSEGIDASVEYVSYEQQLLQKGMAPQQIRESAIGLGYRVPLVIASPWSRGGWVNSQVFDHTSCLQFLEKFLSHKTGKKIEETNISTWRRTVCGDLTSVFRPYNNEKINGPASVPKNEFIESIHKAKFKNVPTNYRRLSKEDIEQAGRDPQSVAWLPKQEKGIRHSCALPYELYVDGMIGSDRNSFQINMQAQKNIFGEYAHGSPFTIYAHGKEFNTRNYAVAAGSQLTDHFSLDEFENGQYDLKLYGPNGFFRAFTGDKNDPLLKINIEYEQGKGAQLTGRIKLKITNADNGHAYTIQVKDNTYKGRPQKKVSGPGDKQPVSIFIDTEASHGWYDFSVMTEGFEHFEQRFAGRVETGKPGYSDPAMGKMI